MDDLALASGVLTAILGLANGWRVSARPYGLPGRRGVAVIEAVSLGSALALLAFRPELIWSTPLALAIPLGAAGVLTRRRPARFADVRRAPRAPDADHGLSRSRRVRMVIQSSRSAWV
ncbi:hypothetical protein [Phenylobacterium sp.]|uniref:hypothetical protein n=1 Tax=Phenylobacterium sp. TaxID=1871053 RepID=UPI0012241862|nr:hypothetical protein [Phenylobacterium sp.]THD61251.1 MAG: hypothetical protein E8A49_09595 [Phenylobacterium sp.]